MEGRKLSRRQLLKAAGAVSVAGVVLDPTKALADDEEDGSQVTWDIVLLTGGAVTRGGHASADAEDGSRITVTGHGTFPNVDSCTTAVTGGGTWSITRPGTDERCFVGSGNYQVTELLSWHPAPGGFLPPSDQTGDEGKPSAGLAILRVLYDNGRRGTLTVSCDLPGAPPCLFEGITASMVYEDFANHEEPTETDGRTLFHVGGGD